MAMSRHAILIVIFAALPFHGCAVAQKPTSEPTCEVTPESLNLITYAGGTGKGYEDAVIIRGAQCMRQAVAAKRRWLDEHYPGYTVVGGARDVDPVGRTTTRVFSTVRVSLPDGATTGVIFDVTETEGA
jgi:hypothetical protein